VAAGVLSRGEAAPPPPGPATSARLPAAPAPALRVGAPVPLGAGRHEARWTPVRRPVWARARPDRAARRVARLATRTPEGTTNIVLALDHREGPDGTLWVRARLPVLPNGTTGWIPRAALGGYQVVRTRLVVDLARTMLTLRRGGRRVLTAPIGIGTATNPTPRGEFYVRNQLRRYASPMYGPLAFGTSARSETLTDWPGGGYVGIHGTDRPELLPGRVSHGCIRLRNADIRALGRLMPVGTPVTIR
jgi:hypothetical protein